jgi:hypothetical protein
MAVADSGGDYCIAFRAVSCNSFVFQKFFALRRRARRGRGRGEGGGVEPQIKKGHCFLVIFRLKFRRDTRPLRGDCLLTSFQCKTSLHAFPGFPWALYVPAARQENKSCPVHLILRITTSSANTDAKATKATPTRKCPLGAPLQLADGTWTCRNGSSIAQPEQRDAGRRKSDARAALCDATL